MPTGLGSTYSWNGGMTRAVRWLLIGNLAMFVVQSLVDVFASGIFTKYLALSSAGVLRAYYWQFVTYMFLHGSLLHIALNMLMLFMIGPELERFMGLRGFLSLYFLSGLLGGVGWLALAYPHPGFCLGASGAIFGVLGAFAALFPRRSMTILLFFIIPITVEAWVLVAGMAFIQLLYLITPGPSGVAYAAHLAGALAGYIYAFVAHRAGGWPRRSAAKPPVENRPNQEEVDRLLDKIAGQGIHSLTQRERDILERASKR